MDVPPEKMKVRELMSALGNAGVELPGNKMNKQFYVDLYRKHILQGGNGNAKKKKKKAKKAQEEEEEEKELMEDVGETEEQEQGEGEDAAMDETATGALASKTKIISRTPGRTMNRKRRRTLLTTATTTDDDDTMDAVARGEGRDEEEEAAAAQEVVGKKKRRTVITMEGSAQQQATPPPPSAGPSRHSQPTPSPAKFTYQKNVETPSASTPAVTVTAAPQRDSRGIRQRPSASHVAPTLTPENRSRTMVTPQYSNARPSYLDSAQVITRPPMPYRNNRRSIINSARSPISPFTPSQVNPKPKRPMRSFFLNLITAIVWASLFFCLFLLLSKHKADPSVPHGLPYCDTEDGGNMLRLDQPNDACQHCPDYGYCVEGRLERCEDLYIIKNAICVEDEGVTVAAMAMIDILQKDLSVLAGKFECNAYEYPHRGMFVEDVRAALETKRVDTNGKFSQCFDKMLSLIEGNGKAFDLSTADVEVQTMSPRDDATAGEQEEQEQSSENVETKRMIYSTAPQIPIMCKIRQRAQENIAYIAGSAIFLLLLFLGNIWRNKMKKAKREKDNLVNMVFTYLKDNERWAIVHLRDEIKEHYKNKIDVLKVWPEVEAEVRSDGRVSEVLGENDARMWVWEAPIPKRKV